jgi:hypothetical protein
VDTPEVPRYSSSGAAALGIAASVFAAAIAVAAVAIAVASAYGASGASRRIRRHLRAVAHPRATGSDGHTAVLCYILRNLPPHFHIEIDAFPTPSGRLARNVYATLAHGGASGHAVIAAHTDSHPDAGDAAIDCATGVAVLLELAHATRTSRFRRLTLAFLDAEESCARAGEASTSPPANAPSAHAPALYGSVRAAQVLRPDIAIVVDLVGTGAPIPFAAGCDRSLWRELLACRGAESVLRDVCAGATVDDHVPFAAGARVALLCPQPFPARWHTRRDVADACDLRELCAITRLLADYVGVSNLKKYSR